MRLPLDSRPQKSPGDPVQFNLLNLQTLHKSAIDLRAGDVVEWVIPTPISANFVVLSTLARPKTAIQR